MAAIDEESRRLGISMPELIRRIVDAYREQAAAANNKR
jgi:hypothetical protein